MQINLSLLSALIRFVVVVIIMIIIIVIIIFIILIIIIINIIKNIKNIIIKDGEAGWMQINLSLLSALTLTACLPCCLGEVRAKRRLQRINIILRIYLLFLSLSSLLLAIFVNNNNSVVVSMIVKPKRTA